MKYNIEDLIDRYFDGQLSATEQTEFMSQVAGDPLAKQLFDTEQFIRGAFTHDLSAVPQAAMEPSASLLAKLSATKPLATQAVQQATQEVTRETATQAVSQSAISQATTVAVKGSAVTGKVAVGGFAAAGKTILGLSVGAFQMAVGAAVTVAIATGVIISSNNSEPDQQQVIAPVTDSANVIQVENKIDTPILVSSTPVTRIETSNGKEPQSAQPTPSVKPAYVPGDPMNDLPAPRINTRDTVSASFNTKQGR